MSRFYWKMYYKHPVFLSTLTRFLPAKHYSHNNLSCEISNKKLDKLALCDKFILVIVKIVTI